MKLWGLICLPVLCTTVCIAQPTLRDITDWLALQPALPGHAHGSGLTLVDVDQDGDLDLFVGTERGEVNQLYLNRPDTGWSEVAQSVGITFDGRTRMALWFDYNADQRLDLLLTSDCDFDDQDCPDLQSLVLYEQQPGFQFVEVTESAGLLGFGPTRADQTIGGVVAGDLNLDGYLDLVLGIRNGELYVLLNEGGMSFRRGNSALGISLAENKYYQPGIVDTQGDGLPDLLCNVDFGANEFWWQQADGTFEEVAQPAGLNSAFNEMGLAIGDYDNDGDFDFYASNIYSYLGRDVYNVLLRNDSRSGFPLFEEVAKDAGVENGGWGWGATFLDLDRDGWLDLATTNGWDLGFEVVDASKLWLNDQLGAFTDVSVEAGFSDSLVANALLAGDIDGDGDLDLVQGLKGYEQPVVLVRVLANESENDHHYLTVRPRMEGTANHQALGAVVQMRVGETTQTRLIQGGGSFYGQEPAEAFFGLGTATTADQVTVFWPGGATTVLEGVSADQTITVLDTALVHAPQYFRGRLQELGYRLDWTDYALGESAYRLERATTPEFTDVEIIEIPANTKVYLDQTPFGNSVNYYRMATVDAQGRLSAYTPVLETPYIVGFQTPGFAGQVWPNPIRSGQILTVALETAEGPNTWQLINAQGQSIRLSGKLVGSGQWHLQIPEVSPGTYWLACPAGAIPLWIKE